MSEFTIDKYELEFPCPKCGFFNPIWFWQARLRDVIICRGCKINIQLDDQMNECKKAERSTRAAMNKLIESVKGLNLTIKL